MRSDFFFLFFLAALSVQAAYAFFYWLYIYRVPTAGHPVVQALPGISVIICAKNEAGRLAQNLPHFLDQKYSGPHEVVLVNDGSTDNTAQVLAELNLKYSHLKVVTIPVDEPRNLKGKKYALLAGAAAAKYDFFLFTDADCRPASMQWLALMGAPFCAGKELVAGFGDYEAGAGLLNAFTRWETRHTFLQYTTYAAAGIPYMAVGRNMGCARKVLEEVSKSGQWNKTVSGDDDMLVCLAATKTNFAVVCNPASFTFSQACGTWGQWAWQKQRHLSTGKYYSKPVQSLLAAYAVSHMAMWLAFVFTVFAGGLALVFWPMAFRCAAYWILWAENARMLRKNKREGLVKSILLFPFFDAGWMLYNFAFSPYIFWKNKQQWKRS